MLATYFSKMVDSLNYWHFNQEGHIHMLYIQSHENFMSNNTFLLAKL
jgi:uncharacterized protein Usg